MWCIRNKIHDACSERKKSIFNFETCCEYTWNKYVVHLVAKFMMDMLNQHVVLSFVKYNMDIWKKYVVHMLTR